MELEICYDGVLMTVEGEYQPYERQTWDYPGSPEYFRVEKVTFEGADITDEFDKKTLSNLEEACLADIKERRDEAKIARYESRNDFRESMNSIVSGVF